MERFDHLSDPLHTAGYGAEYSAESVSYQPRPCWWHLGRCCGNPLALWHPAVVACWARDQLTGLGFAGTSSACLKESSTASRNFR